MIRIAKVHSAACVYTAHDGAADAQARALFYGFEFQRMRHTGELGHYKRERKNMGYIRVDCVTKTGDEDLCLICTENNFSKQK